MFDIDLYIYSCLKRLQDQSACKLQNNSTHSSTTHILLYNSSFICANIFVFIYITFRINVKNDKNYIEQTK